MIDYFTGTIIASDPRPTVKGKRVWCFELWEPKITPEKLARLPKRRRSEGALDAATLDVPPVDLVRLNGP